MWKFLSLIRAVQEGDVDKALTFIATRGDECQSLSTSPYLDPSSGGFLLCEALKENHTKIAKILMEYGSEVNSWTKRGRDTPLHFAVKNENAEIVAMLLDRDANVDARNNLGETPLHLSMKKKNLNIVSLLLNKNADIDVQDRFGVTPLYRAIIEGNVEIVDLLWRNIARTHTRSSEGMDVMHIAAEIGITKIVENGYTPLHCACAKNTGDIVQLLLERGADINVAVERGHLPTIKNIFAIRPQVNIENNLYCIRDYLCGPSIKACPSKIVKTLLSDGFGFHPEDASNCKLLHTAVEKGCTKVVKDLPQYGVDVDSTYVQKNGNKEISGMLLNAGVASNAKDKIEKTALHYACGYKYNEKMVDTLLEFGAKIDSKNSKGSTPLHIAALNGFVKIVETLLKSFADVECTDRHGKTALHIASQNRWPRIVKELLDYGADLNVTCRRGHSTMNYALYGSNVNYMIKKHIIKIKSLNIHDSKQNFESVKLDNEFKHYRVKCEREVELMKSDRIGNTNFSYYDVLMKSTNQLAMLARNKDIVEVLESSIWHEKFPIYYKMLYYKFKKGQKREDLLNPSLKSLNILSKIPIPELASLKVFNVLSNKDLENLIKAVPET